MFFCYAIGAELLTIINNMRSQTLSRSHFYCFGNEENLNNCSKGELKDYNCQTLANVSCT